MNVSMRVLKQRSLPSRERHIIESLSPPYRDVRSQRAACELSTQINVLDKYLRRISAPRRKFSVKNENRARGLSRDFTPLPTKALASAAFSPSASNKWPRGNNNGGGFSFNFRPTPSPRGADLRSLITFSLRRPAPSGRIALHFIQSLHQISSSYADKLYASSPALTPDQRRADFRARQSQNKTFASATRYQPHNSLCVISQRHSQAL